MQTDAFAPQATTTQTTEESANPLNLLVGEGKKFKSVEDLAKGKLEADRFIEQVLREKAELQETLTKLTTEAQVQQSISQETPSTNTNKSKVGESPDIKALVQQTITELFAERETQNNVVEVNKKLQSTFGDRAADIVAQRASELNVGVEFLRSVAAKSPTAFYKLLDTTGAVQPSGSVAQSTVTIPAGGETKASRTWADYQAIRKSNPTLYHSPAIQKEIYTARKEGRLVIPS